jgi:hypothetical protein
MTFCLLGRFNSNWTMPSTLFVLVILELGSHFMPGPLSSYLCFPMQLGMIGAYHHTQPLIEMRVL